jgi:hypothetical protein
MAIDTLFTKDEQIDILWSVRRAKIEYGAQGTSKSRMYYFSSIADQYNLLQRLKKQVEDYKNEQLIQEDITTNSEIADLFQVKINAVESYLARRATNGEKAERGSLCLKKGRAKGWEYLKNSGRLHKLTNEDLTKPKKYYGRKKRTHKSLGNS